MAKKLFDRTLATTISDTERIAFGTGSTPAGNILWSAFKTLLLGTSWIEPTLAAGYANVPYNTFKYRLNKVGQLEIKGGITNTGGSTSAFFTLPSGYRPDRTIYFSCIGVNGLGAGDPYMLQITTGGLMEAFGGGGLSSNHETHFNAVINL